MKNKPLMYGIIAVVVIAIVFIIVYFTRKNKAIAQSVASNPPIPVSSGGTVSAPCVPYTQAQYERDLQGLRGKCNPKLLIPVVGIGAYNKCMQEGKASLPPIKNCF